MKRWELLNRIFYTPMSFLSLKQQNQNNECSKVNIAISTANITYFIANTYCSHNSTWTIEIINPTLSAVYTHRTVLLMKAMGVVLRQNKWMSVLQYTV